MLRIEEELYQHSEHGGNVAFESAIDYENTILSKGLTCTSARLTLSITTC